MNFTELDKFMSDMGKRGFVGCALAVAVDGKEVYRKAFGFSDSKGTREARTDDIYWIFSATKVLTCIAAMRLVEEGKLSLSDPVSKYLPAYADIKIKNADGTLSPPKNEMKIIHLFTMTGGLSYDIDTPAVKGLTADMDTVASVQEFVKDNILFEPGTRYKYSLCHDVLGAVCQVVTGKNLQEYMDELFFAPLGLKDIGFKPSEEQKKRFAAMYEYSVPHNTSQEISLTQPYIFHENYYSGGAGLFTSVEDYIKIIAAVANNGITTDGYRILKPETIRLMQENHLCDKALEDFIQYRFHGYGFGLCGRVHIDPTVSLSLSPKGEFGWDGAANAFVMIDPENRIAVFYATHVMGCRYGYVAIHPKIRELVYKALKA